MKEKIRLENISLLSRSNVKEERKIILDKVSATIHEGEIYTIIGPSGAGKSSLLRLINRLEERDQGNIYIDGKDIDEYDVISLRRRYGLVAQIPALHPTTVEKNILFGPSLLDRKPPQNRDSALKLMELVGLEEGLIDRNILTLSVGQQQRVAFARVLANEPEALLLDEPTSALDPSATFMIEDLIKRLNRDLKLTIVFITHIMEQAKRIGERTLFLINGKRVLEGDTKELFGDENRGILKKFIHGEMR